MITNKDYIMSTMQLNINYAHLQILETVPQPGHKLQSPHWGGNPFKILSILQTHARHPIPALVISETSLTCLAPPE
jgi:hypothetical protein